MDDRRFDALARALAAGPSPRRAALRLLGGGALGGLLALLGTGGAGATHTGCRHAGRACTKDGQCCSRDCLGNGTCRCTKAAQCPQPENECKKAVCTATGKCAIRNKADGAAYDGGKTCEAGVCTGGTTCPSGTTACDGACVDLRTDEGNCGGCGNACAGAATCQDGTCVPVCGDGHCDAGAGEDCANCPMDCGQCP